MAKTKQAHTWAINYAKIDASSSGNNTLVAAVTNKRIRVLSYTVVAPSAVTIKFQSAAGGTDISGPMAFSANGGSVNNFNEGGWFQTNAGELLNLTLNTAVQVGGHLSYQLIPADAS